MVQLPIGFFMPLPLPIMIPFMMWQSAAIAAGFGTYFQYAKRRISAMSNEEFNASNPHDLVNSMYDELIQAMPSSFKKIEKLTPIILDSMLKMLTDATDWFAGILGGTGLTELQRRLAGGDPLNPLLPGQDFGDSGTETPITPEPKSSFSESTIKTWSLQTLSTRKSQPFIGTVDDATQNLIVKWFIIKREEAKKKQKLTVPGTPINLGNYQVPTQQFIPSLTVKRYNQMLNAKKYKEFVLLIAAHRATAVRTIAQSRSIAVTNRWKGLLAEYNKIIADFNKIINT